MTVLVTDAKYKMALAAVRDLGRNSYQVEAVHIDDNRTPACAYSKYLSKLHIIAAEDEESYTNNLLDLCKKIQLRDKKKAIILPVGAFTIRCLAKRRDIFSDHADFLLPSDSIVEQANNKTATLKTAKEIGVPIPKDFGTDLASVIKNATYPAVIKYRYGEKLGITAAERYRIANNEKQLIDYYRKMDSVQKNPIVQEYVLGDGFGVSCVFDKDCKPISIVCHKRLLEYPTSGGPSALCESAWEPKAINYAVKLLQAMKWQGIAMVEFKKTQDLDYVLMEINPRIWGSYPLTTKIGSGFSSLYCRSAAGEMLEECNEADYPLGKKIYFLPMCIKAFFSLTKQGKLAAALKVLGSIINPLVPDGIITLNDFRASLAYIVSGFKRNI